MQHSPHESDRDLPCLIRAEQLLEKHDKTQGFSAPLIVLLLIFLLCTVGVLSLIASKPETSVYENRKLAPMPTFSVKALLTGQYARDLENFYADTFPQREELVRVAARVEGSFGIRTDDVRIHTATPSPVNKEPAPKPHDDTSSADTSTSPADKTASEDSRSADYEVGEKQGSVFMYKGQAFAMFGSNLAAAGRYSQTINNWKATLGDNATVYNLVVPSHIEFALPERYKDISAPQKPNIDAIYAALDPRVRSVDAYTQMMAHKDEYIFFGTDHHWTALGAYYAYVAFCAEAGFAPYPLEKMEKRTLENFVGTMYSQTQDPVLLDNPDHVDYWMIPTPHTALQYRRGSPFYGAPVSLLGEYAQSPNSYSLFLHGDYPLTKITTNIQNGRKIVVVKESYGNAFAPFLVNHYQEVYVIDQRYFELNLPAFMGENGIGEILFINNIAAANTDIRIHEIARLQTQYYVPPAPVEEEEEEEPASSAASSKSASSKKAKSKAPISRVEEEEDDDW